MTIHIQFLDITMQTGSTHLLFKYTKNQNKSKLEHKWLMKYSLNLCKKVILIEIKVEPGIIVCTKKDDTIYQFLIRILINSMGKGFLFLIIFIQWKIAISLHLFLFFA